MGMQLMLSGLRYKLPLTRMLQHPNKQSKHIAISGVRTSAECSHEDLKQAWERDYISSLLKVRHFPVGLLYGVLALLLNFKTCIEKGGQVRNSFQYKAPDFYEYVSL